MIINTAELAHTVGAKIFGKVDANPQDFTEFFDEDQLVEQAIEELIADLPNFKLKFDAVMDLIGDHPLVQMALAVSKLSIEEWIEDQAEYAKGPMHYNGLKQSDFV